MRELEQAAAARSALRRGCAVAARVAVCALFLLLLHGLSPAAEARGEGASAELSAAVEGGHARLVFTFSSDVKANVQVSNGILIVAFSQPVALTTEGIRERLPGYVQAVRHDPDGTALRMSLTRKVRVNSMEAGERLFVDLLPEGWAGLPPGLPQSVIDDLAKRARDAERRAAEPRSAPAATAEEPVLQTVRLQVSSAPTFSRFSFELPAPIEVGVEREGQEMRLNFGSRVRVDLGAARTQLPKGVVGLDVAFQGMRSTVKLVLAPNAEARDFREDRAVIVDVTPAPIGGSAPVMHDLAVKAEAQATEDRARAEAAAAKAAEEEKHAAAAVAPKLAETAGGEIPAAPLDFTSDPTAASAGKLVPVVGRNSGHFSLDFAFNESVSAAVFTRGEDIWLVFDTEREIDVSGIIEEPTRSVHDVRSLRSDLGAAIRIKPTIARLPSIERDGNTWRLTLADSVTAPSRPLPVRRATGVNQQGAVLVPLESPVQVHRLADPDIGDTMLIVTALPPTRGVLREQRFVEFRALASMHGLAFVPLADDLAVTLTPDGALLRRPEGLAVSSLSAPPPPPRSTADVQPQSSALDPEGWRAEQGLNFAAREAVLVDSVASSPSGQRAEARLMLARFYLAHGFEAEAIGVLEAGAREDNQILTRPLYSLLRGIAELEIGRPENALQHFRHKQVAELPVTSLLRAVANSDLGRWTAARDAQRAGMGAFDGLPNELQYRVLFAGARAAVEVRDLNAATRYMQDLELMQVPPEREAEFMLLSARIAENVGRFDRAKTLYESVAEADAGPASADARFRWIAMRHARGELDRGKAIERLETLAMVWRGDRIELDTIRLLGRLYVRETRYRDAFKLLDAALMVNAEAETTHEFHGEMAAVFEDLFLTGKAETLPSIEALALYYDFSRLTPIGRRGDELIRRLADRLVSVDLLDQAAELLDHQVNYRLTGAAKAQVATKLAIVYLMNRKPADAARVLVATRIPQMPAELREQRMLVEARALSETGRHDTALELLESVRGPEADRLRADVHWAAKNWREAGERLEALVGERWKADALDASDRHDVLRAALAYTLGEEQIGLARIRDKFAEKMGETTEGKVLALLVSAEGASPRTLTEAARALASFDSLGMFIARYRERYPEQPLEADPTPTSSLFKVERMTVR